MKRILLKNRSLYLALNHVYKCHTLYEYCLLKNRFHTIVRLDSSSSRGQTFPRQHYARNSHSSHTISRFIQAI